MSKAAHVVSVLYATMLLLPVTSPASAKQRCGPRDQAIKQLTQKYHEYILGRSITPTGNAIYELFVSEKGPWSVLASSADGRSCIMADGESWQRIPLPIGDPS